MANTERLDLNHNGAMFVPMNVEGGGWDDHFLTTPKIVALVGIGASAIVIWLYFSSIQMSVLGYILAYLIWFLISLTVTRYVIFEEAMYYKMYKEMLDGSGGKTLSGATEIKVDTPGLFWNIASINETPDGCIFTFSDGKIGAIIKLERDTIVGKQAEFMEAHYDAISDFYRYLLGENYSFVHLNTMETAGSDPRLPELDKLIVKSQNPNLRKLMEMEVGHIKNIANSTLYESDYILIYVPITSKMDTIITDIIEAAYILLNGAYRSYKILNRKEIGDMMAEFMGVKYFDLTEATINVFGDGRMASVKAFDIVGVVWDDGVVQDFDSKEKSKVNSMTSGIVKGTLKPEKASFKKAVYAKRSKNSFGIDYSELSKTNTKKGGRTSGSVDDTQKSTFGNLDLDFNVDLDDIDLDVNDVKIDERPEDTSKENEVPNNESGDTDISNLSGFFGETSDSGDDTDDVLDF